jgi:ankyrin repeat protein
MTTNNTFEIIAVEPDFDTFDMEQEFDPIPRIEIDTNNNPLLERSFFEALVLNSNTFDRKIDIEAFSVLSFCQILQINKENQEALLDKYSVDKKLLSKYLKLSSLELEEEDQADEEEKEFNNQERYKKIVSLCLDLALYEKAAQYIGKINEYNFREIYYLILANKIDANVQDNDGLTVLHWCAKIKMENSVLELIKTGKCDYNIQDNDGETILHKCADNFMEKCILELIETDKCDYNIQDNTGITILHYCAINEMENCVLELIKTNKCDYNIQNRLGNTILHMCGGYMERCILELIKTNNCDYNIQNQEGWTVLDLYKKYNLEKCISEINMYSSNKDDKDEEDE